MMVCLQLLQGIVRPLTSSTNQSSAMQRSRSAADSVLQAHSRATNNPATNGRADQVVTGDNQLSFVPSALAKETAAPASASKDCGLGSVGVSTEKRAGRRSRKTTLNTEEQEASTTDAQKAVDMNENVITSRQVPSCDKSDKSGEISEKVTLPFVKPSSASAPTLSPTGDQNVDSDLTLVKSLSHQTDKSGLEDGTTDSRPLPTGTRSWVSSSSYRQKLGSQAASRYQNITSRLYGDSWLGELSNTTSKASMSKVARSASDTVPLQADSSRKFKFLRFQPADMADDSPNLPGSASSSISDNGSQPTKSASSLHYVYSCSTSNSTVVNRPSLTSDSGDDNDDNKDVNESSEVEDDDDDDDDEDDDGVTADAAGLGQHPKHSDAMLTKDVMRWRQRLVASPPPRRATHTPRRFEDPDKELNTVTPDVMASQSMRARSPTLCFTDAPPVESPRSPESSKHVSFDPFTLSLNAALERELDVLRSLFSQVAPF